jgi:hypothetical protein
MCSSNSHRTSSAAIIVVTCRDWTWAGCRACEGAIEWTPWKGAQLFDLLFMDLPVLREQWEPQPLRCLHHGQPVLQRLVHLDQRFRTDRVSSVTESEHHFCWKISRLRC